jgi:hypothetical protein
MKNCQFYFDYNFTPSIWSSSAVPLVGSLYYYEINSILFVQFNYLSHIINDADAADFANYLQEYLLLIAKS